MRCSFAEKSLTLMSSPKFRLIFTKRAQNDLRSIEIYTEMHWGTDKADEYEASINQTIEIIRENPGIGRRVFEDRLGLRYWPAGQYVVYYRIARESLTIVRILHGRADALRHL